MNQKHRQNIFHVPVNVNFMVENLIRMKSGDTINLDRRAKTQ